MELAREEEGHLASLRGLVGEEPPPAAPAKMDVKLNAPDGEDLRALAAHEEATAEFYSGLAAKTRLPGVGSVLSRLADEERSHAERLLAYTAHVEGV